MHFCRIINNFLLFYHGQLIRNILESLSKHRVVCLEQETTYVAPSRLLVGALQLVQFAVSFALPSPPSPYRRLSWVVFVVGTVEDCILGVQTVVSLFQAFRWWGTRRTSPESREQAKLLAAYKKDRGLFFYCLFGGRGRNKIECPILFWAPPLFISLHPATGKPRNIWAIFAPSNSFFLFLQKKVVGCPWTLLVGTNRSTYNQPHQTEQLWTVVVGQPKTGV